MGAAGKTGSGANAWAHTPGAKQAIHTIRSKYTTNLHVTGVHYGTARQLRKEENPGVAVTNCRNAASRQRRVFHLDARAQAGFNDSSPYCTGLCIHSLWEILE